MCSLHHFELYCFLFEIAVYLPTIRINPLFQSEYQLNCDYTFKPLVNYIFDKNFFKNCTVYEFLRLKVTCKKEKNIRVNQIFILLLLTCFGPLNRTGALPGGTVLVRSWPRPATLCLTWTGTLASLLREMMGGGAFGAGSNVGSSLKYKTESNASWPGYSQAILQNNVKKKKKVVQLNISNMKGTV